MRIEPTILIISFRSTHRRMSLAIFLRKKDFLKRNKKFVIKDNNNNFSNNLIFRKLENRDTEKHVTTSYISPSIIFCDIEILLLQKYQLITWIIIWSNIL